MNKLTLTTTTHHIHTQKADNDDSSTITQVKCKGTVRETTRSNKQGIKVNMENLTNTQIADTTKSITQCVFKCSVVTMNV